MYSLVAVTDHENRVANIVGPTIEDMGFELVRVRIGGGQRRQQLQIMAERQVDGGMEIDDCAKVSKRISAILDAEEPISEKFTLEVSSPGVDRPLTRLKDFETWKGHRAKIRLSQPIDGQQAFTGEISAVDGENICLQVEDTQKALAFPIIASAKLLITDKLLRQGRTQAKPKKGLKETK